MDKLRFLFAILLALPLIVFGGNHFVQLFELPAGDVNAGVDLLLAMGEGGLMGPIAASHVLIGVMLLLPVSRFLGGLLQLPVSLGITAFHGTMLPAGLGLALGMLVLNLAVIAEPGRLRQLLRKPPSR